MFISEAYAQAAAGGGGFDNLQQFLPLVLIFVVFYFLLLRPQQKKMKAHREMVAQLRRGDRVLIQGGIIGQINKVLSDTEVMIEIADGVRVRRDAQCRSRGSGQDRTGRQCQGTEGSQGRRPAGRPGGQYGTQDGHGERQFDPGQAARQKVGSG